MKRRLSLPLLRSIAVLGYAAMVVLSVIATARDFHLTSFVGGVFLTIASYDARRFFLPTRGHNPMNKFPSALRFNTSGGPSMIANSFTNDLEQKELAFYASVVGTNAIGPVAYGSSDALIATWEQMLSDFEDRKKSPNEHAGQEIPVALIKSQLQAGANPNDLSKEAIHFFIESLPFIRFLTGGKGDAGVDLLDVLTDLVFAGWNVDGRSINLLQQSTGTKFYRRVVGDELLANLDLLTRCVVSGPDYGLEPIGRANGNLFVCCSKAVA